MSKVGRWSTTAANNNATPPDGWPEGQAPSTVNDCARENMAAIKTAMQDMDFFDHDFTPTFINANSFSVPGDQTSRIVAGRQLKLYDATTHIRDVGSASFTTVTTISLGAGTALTSSLSSFAISIINPNSSALPNSFNRISASAIEVTATLTVSSAAILANLSVAGYLSASAGQVTGVLSTSSIVATGPVTLGTTLSVSGAVVLASTFTVAGATALNGTLSLSGAATFSGTLTVSAGVVALTTLTVGNTLTAQGATALGSTLSVSGATVLKAALSVGGAVNVAGLATFAGQISAPQVFKVWCNFSGAGVVTLQQSFGVASISDNGVGDYAVNFNYTLSASGYAALAMAMPDGVVLMMAQHASGYAKTTTAFRVTCHTPTTSQTDCTMMSVGIMGT